MDTRDAKEILITLALPDDDQPTFGTGGLEVTATTDDGVVLGAFTESEDIEAGTGTLRFELPTSNQVGIELGVSGSCHWGGPIEYVMSAVAR